MASSAPGSCWSCGVQIPADGYRRSDSCPKCGRDTRVCRNCPFYDPAYRTQCREDRAEPVAEREKANFCEFFTPSSAPRQPSADFKGSSAAKAAFENLFKKKN